MRNSHPVLQTLRDAMASLVAREDLPNFLTTIKGLNVLDSGISEEEANQAHGALARCLMRAQLNHLVNPRASRKTGEQGLSQQLLRLHGDVTQVPAGSKPRRSGRRRRFKDKNSWSGHPKPPIQS